MNKVKFQLAFVTNDKIKAIKLIRSVAGFGLKEAKDFCDVAFNRMERVHPQTIVMSYEQFGCLQALSQSAETELVSCFNVELVREENSVFDFTKV